jgi:hypothetical protein
VRTLTALKLHPAERSNRPTDRESELAGSGCYLSDVTAHFGDIKGTRVQSVKS